MTPDALLALDFGGTKLAAAVLDPQTERWLSRERCISPSRKEAQAVLARMLSLADAQLAQVGRRPAAIGISFDGPVDRAGERPRTCHHVAGWEGFPLREYVANHFRAPAVLENDANAGAMGEWRYGAGRGCQSMLYVTVSTGIGGGLILNSALHRGAHGLAGEIGHMCLEPDGPPCACGRRGCLEALAAGPALVRQMREALDAEPDAPSALRGQERITAEDVSRVASRGDQLAKQVLRDAARALGIAIGNALNLIDLQRVVLGGGVSKAGDDYLSWVRQAARETVLDGIVVDIVLSALGDDAPLWGACSLAKELLDT